MDWRWKTLRITYNCLNISVAYRFNIHGWPGGAAQSPIAVDMTFIFNQALKRLSFLPILFQETDGRIGFIEISHGLNFPYSSNRLYLSPPSALFNNQISVYVGFF